MGWGFVSGSPFMSVRLMTIFSSARKTRRSKGPGSPPRRSPLPEATLSPGLTTHSKTLPVRPAWISRRTTIAPGLPVSLSKRLAKGKRLRLSSL
jgi:hypothetical protein